MLYPFYAAAPRITALTRSPISRLGGVIMWVPAGLIPLVAFTAVFFRWAAAEAEEPIKLASPLHPLLLAERQRSADRRAAMNAVASPVRVQFMPVGRERR